MIVSNWTAPQLFAGKLEEGEEICFYCAGKCLPENPSSKIVKDSFTARDTVTSSKWVCNGCLSAMHESYPVKLVTGEVREGQKVRLYSWVFGEGWKIAATKSHRECLLQLCLNPPPAPYVISLSDSGQKHLLYRSIVVRESDGPATVCLEGKAITYYPEQLLERINLAKKMCSAIGKVALLEALDIQTQMRVCEAHGSSQWLYEWLNCWTYPISKLAVWLCPPKEACLDDSVLEKIDTIALVESFRSTHKEYVNEYITKLT